MLTVFKRGRKDCKSLEYMMVRCDFNIAEENWSCHAIVLLAGEADRL